MKEEKRNRLYLGFACIQAAMIIQLFPYVTSLFIWRVIWAMPIQMNKWLTLSYSLILAGLQLLIFVLVFKGVRLLDNKSAKAPLMRARIRRIHMAFILLIAWSLVQFVDRSLRFVDIVALPWHPIFRDSVVISQALVWFIILFNGILVAMTANNQLGDLRFSYATLIMLLSVSLFLWLVHTTYMMYRGEFIFREWTYMAISYGIPALTISWLIWVVILLGIARRRIALILHCSNCGYNLTGNNSGTCPECGKTISDAAPTGPDPLPVIPAEAS